MKKSKTYYDSWFGEYFNRPDIDKYWSRIEKDYGFSSMSDKEKIKFLKRKINSCLYYGERDYNRIRRLMKLYFKASGRIWFERNNKIKG